jgi:hypothetical protein
MFHAACGLSKCSTNMLHRSIETTTVAIPTRRAGLRHRSEHRGNRGKGPNCALHHFFLYRGQFPAMFLLCSAAIVLAEPSQGEEAVPEAGRFP